MEPIPNKVKLERKNMNKIFVNNIGDLAQAQRASFYRFLTTGITEELENVSNPIVVEALTVGRVQIYLYPGQIKLDQNDFSIVETCLAKDLTYAISLYVGSEYYLGEEKKSKGNLKKELKTTSARIKQDILLGEIPLMTEDGTFIINGCERIVISQIIRSPGIYFRKEGTSIKNTTYTATLISNRGIWTKFVYEYPSPSKPQHRHKMYIKLNEFRSKSEVKEPRESIKNKLFLSEILDYFGLTFEEIEDSLNYSEEFFNKHYPNFPANPEEQPDRLAPWKKDKKKLIKKLEKKKPEIRIEPKRPSLERNDLIKSMFLKEQTGCFSIGEVGRYRINKRLNLRIPKEVVHLSALDFLEIINGLMELKFNNRSDDDIDDIKNKLVRSVGELLQIQFRGALWILKKQLLDAKDDLEEISKVLDDRKREESGLMSDIDIDSDMMNEEFPDLVELDELEEKQKASKSRTPLVPFIEKGGHNSDQFLLDRALFDPRIFTSSVRDFFKTSQLSQYMDQINPLAELSHKRRISVFGPNGLKRDHISNVIRDIHPSQYGRLCPIETPEGQNAGLITSIALFGRVGSLGSIETPYFWMDKEKVYSSQAPIFLDPDQEAKTKIAFCDTVFDHSKKITSDYVSIKEDSLFSVKKMNELNFLTISPLQIISLAASLIPFIEHDDANRALMGSNMQRQAVPLIYPQKPIIGTGLEAVAILDSGMVVKSYAEGTVSYSCSRKIVIVDSTNQKIQYQLIKYRRSNQETCINQRPIVWLGEKVFSGQIIADGPSTSDGELSLGQNLTIGYLPWEGYNFEDAIILNERMVTEDCLTSVHIEEIETTISYNMYGAEKCSKKLDHLTRYIRRNLSSLTGIIREGSYVKPQDILIGKLTPCEEDLSPEKKLIKVLFKRPKEQEYKDTSLRAGPGTEGRVIDIRILIGDEYLRRREEDPCFPVFPNDEERVDKKFFRQSSGIDKGQEQETGKPSKMEIEMAKIACKKSIADREQALKEAQEAKIKLNKKKKKQDLEEPEIDVQNHDFVTYKIKIYIAQIRKIQVGDKLAGRHGNKGIVSRILPRQDMPYLPDGTPLDILFNPLGVPSRMNVGQVFECLLGLAGEKLETRFKVFPFDEVYGKEASRILVNQKLKEASIKSGMPWLFNSYYPGKILLRDGRTGEYFDNPITVGKSYILKLIHLVEDKIHTRSTGPYAMITEQPLAGKSQKGGQRFGEMEVWALEGYGCSNTLQELLTIKSDDMDGRNDMYDSILKRKEIEKPNPSIPEAFLTLIRELNALGLDFSTRKIHGGSLTAPRRDAKKREQTQQKEGIEEIDLFKQIESRLKLRALLTRKKSENFSREQQERESEEEKEKMDKRREEYRKVLENFRKLQDENRKKSKDGLDSYF